jgi:LPS export ABC transporter protein LptC
MMRKAKMLILILLVLIAGAVITSIWMNLRGKEDSGEGEGLPMISTEGADMRLEKIRFVEDKHGQKTWELEAKLIQQYQDQNIVLLEDMKVTFYMKDGRSFILTGKKGKVYQDSKNMELAGDVLLTSSDGYQMKTHSISYDHLEKRVTTSDPVEIEGKEIQLVGKGMLVDMEAKILKVLHQVKTRWKGGEKG